MSCIPLLCPSTLAIEARTTLVTDIDGTPLHHGYRDRLPRPAEERGRRQEKDPWR